MFNPFYDITEEDDYRGDKLQNHLTIFFMMATEAIDLSMFIKIF